MDVSNKPKKRTYKSDYSSKRTSTTCTLCNAEFKTINCRKNLLEHFRKTHIQRSVTYYEGENRLYYNCKSWIRLKPNRYQCLEPDCTGLLEVKHQGKREIRIIISHKCPAVTREAIINGNYSLEIGEQRPTGENDIIYDGVKYTKNDMGVYTNQEEYSRCIYKENGTWRITSPREINYKWLCETAYKELSCYKCDECEEKTLTEEEMRTHRKNVHNKCAICNESFECDKYTHFAERHSFTNVGYKQYLEHNHPFEWPVSTDSSLDEFLLGEICGGDYKPILSDVSTVINTVSSPKFILMKEITKAGLAVDPSFTLSTISTNEKFAQSFKEIKALKGDKYYEYGIQKNTLPFLTHELEIDIDAPPYRYCVLFKPPLHCLYSCPTENCSNWWSTKMQSDKCKEHSENSRRILAVYEVLSENEYMILILNTTKIVKTNIDSYINNLTNWNIQKSVGQNIKITNKRLLGYRSFSAKDKNVSEMASLFTQTMIGLFVVTEAYNMMNKDKRITLINSGATAMEESAMFANDIISKSGIRILWQTECDLNQKCGNIKNSTIKKMMAEDICNATKVYVEVSDSGDYYVGQKTNNTSRHSLSRTPGRVTGRHKFESEYGRKLYLDRSLTLNGDENIDSMENLAILIGYLGDDKNEYIRGHPTMNAIGKYKIINHQIKLKPVSNFLQDMDVAQTLSYFLFGKFIHFQIPKNFQTRDIGDIIEQCLLPK